MNAINSFSTATPLAVTLGSVPPFTRSGNSYDTKSGEQRKIGGTGSTTLYSNRWDYSSSYLFHVNSTGTYNVQIQYSTTATATLIVEYGGNVIGTYNLASTGGVSPSTAYANINCTADKLYSIRCVVTSGNVTIVNAVVGTGPMSVRAFRLDINTEEVSKLSVYPNPVKAGDFLTISGLKGSETSTIQIVDLSGKILQSKTIAIGNVAYPLNTLGLSKGIYLLQISNNGTIANQKLIIE